MEFLNTWRENDNLLKMFAKIWDKVYVTDKYILGEIYNNFIMGLKEEKHVEKSKAKMAI